MTLRDITFNHPGALSLLLILIPLLLLQASLLIYRNKRLSAFVAKRLMPLLLVPRLYSYWKMALSACLWTFLCIALMDPIGNIHYAFANSPTEIKPHDFSRRSLPHEVVFLVDTSASMGVKDGEEGESRLRTAQEIMEEVISLLKGELASLYSFTSVLTPLVPPTYDYLFTRLIIKSLSINHGDVGGTHFQKILTDLKEKLFVQPQQKTTTLVLLSDGGDQVIEKTEGAARQEAMNNILASLPSPETFHFRLLTIGVGKEMASMIPHVKHEGEPVYSKLEPAILEALASRFNGTYYPAADWRTYELAHALADEIGAVATEPTQSLQRTVFQPKSQEILYDLYYQIPLGISLLIFLAYLLLPEARKLLILVLLFNSLAASTINQEGNRAIALTEARDLEGAEALFEGLGQKKLPDWQQALVLYDLGIVQLLKQEWIQALDVFKSIPRANISTPELLRSLTLNKAFAALGQAKWLATLPENDLQEELYFVWRSKADLQEVRHIDCRIQNMEGADSCTLSWQVEAGIEQALYQEKNIRERQYTRFIKEASVRDLKFLLMQGLKKILLNEEEASTLKPLWNQLTKLKEGEGAHAAFQKEAYEEALQKITLDPPLSALEEAHLEARLLLIKEIQKEDLIQLKNLMEGNEEAVSTFDKAASSEKPLPYFLAGLISINEMKTEVTPKTPLTILQNGLLNAEILQILIQLASLKNTLPDDLIQTQQVRLQKEAASFIEAVHAEQKENNLCHRSPWDEVIPIYEKGWNAVRLNSSWIKINPLPFEDLLKQLKITILAWRQAIELLKHPPQSGGQKQTEAEAESSASMEETLREIQEMHGEDQPGETAIQAGEGTSW
ncbi:MAG: VWA domain-containing protein [Parachlamydia sp.]|nr:VWA domain-containing protein [Parachlamydia sp.]